MGAGDERGDTALIAAAAADKGFSEIVDRLLAQGANPSVAAATGITPLTAALRSGTNRLFFGC